MSAKNSETLKNRKNLNAAYAEPATIAGSNKSAKRFHSGASSGRSTKLS
jgi:hypothetical protein